LLACALGVAACSGNTELTGPDWRERTQAECGTARDAVESLPEPTPGDTAAQVKAGRKALDIQRGALGEIQSLDAPTGLESEIGRWLDLTGQVLDAAERSLDAQANEDLAETNAANNEGSAAATRADVLAHRLRIPACAG
jgi:hypothetical protein